MFVDTPGNNIISDKHQVSALTTDLFFVRYYCKNLMHKQYIAMT